MDTVAALATAPFKSAIGVIRMSGPDAFVIAEKCLCFPGTGRLISEDQRRNLSFGRICVGDEVLDEAVIAAYRGPHSYTGEDTVEFFCHGGVYLLSRVLEMLFSLGARQALAGEFTKRAFLNGKTDLTRAEGVMDLIDAEYASSARIAMNELDGSVGKAILEIDGQITALCAKLLAYVDYPDDEIGEISAEELENSVTSALERTVALQESYHTGRILKEGVRTVLCGKPNVGKSSLMNRLSGWDRSIVTDIAGTTRDTVEETVVFAGCKLILTDTAGIRETQDTVEKIGVLRSRSEMEKAQLILCIFGEEITEEDGALAEFAASCEGKTLFLFNKSDCSRVDLPSWAAPEDSFRVSARTGEGLDQVEEKIREVFLSQLPLSGTVISNPRQYQCLCRVQAALARAKENLCLTPDVLLTDLEEAMEAVGEITGRTVSERVVTEIFSRFCVGK